MANYGPRDCARLYQQNAVLTASPGQLVVMLYDGVLKCLARARAAHERPKSDHRRFQAINQELIKAQAILNELKSTLNHEAGGEFARTMAGLYAYHMRRLREANMTNTVEPIMEVEALLTQIRDAWAEMLRTYDPSKPSPQMAAAVS